MEGTAKALSSYFKFRWSGVLLLCIALILTIWDLMGEHGVHAISYLLLFFYAFNFFLARPYLGQKMQYNESPNPFDVIRVDSTTLYMDDMRFGIENVKQVIIQPSKIYGRKAGEDIGLIVFFRNHRDSCIPNLVFDIAYIDDLKAYFQQNLPNTEVIEDSSYFPMPYQR